MSDAKQPNEAAGVVDPEQRQRAAELFDSAGKAADPDHAISLYLQGLDLDPLALEAGHKKLYEAALRRARRSGKGPGAMEKMKFQAVKSSLDRKNPREGMLKAEALWAKEPNSAEYLEAALRCARAVGFEEVAQWMSDTMVGINQAAEQAARVQDPVMKRRALELFASADKAPDPDYALTLYLQGLNMYPDAAEEGHQKLYEAALRRRQRGGKAPGMFDRAKWEMAKLTLEKDPKAGMLKAEEMWSKDPMNLEYLEYTARCALKGGYSASANWLCDTLVAKATSESKPSPRVFRTAADLYRELGNAAKQVEALERYIRAKPDDTQAVSELKNAQAQKSIDSGKYSGKATDNVDEQQRTFYDGLFSQDTHKEEARDHAVLAAKAEYEKEPGNVAKVRKYANALVEKSDEASENEAIALLTERYERLGDYTLKQRADDIRIRQLDRKGAELLKRRQAEPGNEALKAEAATLVGEIRRTKLAIYREQHKQYPTDNEILYKLGVELYNCKLYDEAIPAFQQAQNEPRIQIDALYWLGMSFARNGLVDAAVDEFKEAIGKYEIEKDDRSKRLHYALARCHEQNDQFADAAEEYKLLARWDYNYMDVRDRLKAVTEKVRGA
jgi:hypothetical protein